MNEQPAHFCKQSQPYLRFAFYVETFPSEWYEVCRDEAGRKFLSVPATYCQWCGMKLSQNRSEGAN